MRACQEQIAKFSIFNFQSPPKVRPLSQLHRPPGLRRLIDRQHQLHGPPRFGTRDHWRAAFDEGAAEVADQNAMAFPAHAARVTAADFECALGKLLADGFVLGLRIGEDPTNEAVVDQRG